MRDMPSMNTRRAGHGCTSFLTGGERVLMVTGGWDDNRNNVDSTEILRIGADSGRQTTSARLPRPIQAVSVSTLDNRVLLFGELI